MCFDTNHEIARKFHLKSGLGNVEKSINSGYYKFKIFETIEIEDQVIVTREVLLDFTDNKDAAVDI